MLLIYERYPILVAWAKVFSGADPILAFSKSSSLRYDLTRHLEPAQVGLGVQRKGEAMTGIRRWKLVAIVVALAAGAVWLTASTAQEEKSPPPHSRQCNPIWPSRH